MREPRYSRIGAVTAPYREARFPRIPGPSARGQVMWFRDECWTNRLNTMPGAVPGSWVAEVDALSGPAVRRILQLSRH
jgi:hypothetical protein